MNCHYIEFDEPAIIPGCPNIAIGVVCISKAQDQNDRVVEMSPPIVGTVCEFKFFSSTVFLLVSGMSIFQSSVKDPARSQSESIGQAIAKLIIMAYGYPLSSPEDKDADVYRWVNNRTRNEFAKHGINKTPTIE
jgi:hypothetical protein